MLSFRHSTAGRASYTQKDRDDIKRIGDELEQEMLVIVTQALEARRAARK